MADLWIMPWSPESLLSRRRFLLAGAGAWVGGAGLALAAQVAGESSAEEEGRRLAAELCAQPPAFNTGGTLRRRPPEGRWLAPIPVRLDVYPVEPGWRSVYQAFSLAGAVTETLEVRYQPGAPTLYEHTTLEAGPGLPRSRTLLGEEACVPFAGSDFWLCDLGLEFLRWPTQRVSRSETRKGRFCRVLESLSPHPRPTAYGRVLSWVDAQYRGLLRAEAYGADGRLRKEFSIGGFKKVRGNWLLKDMELRDAQSDSRTRIEFDLEIPE